MAVNFLNNISGLIILVATVSGMDGRRCFARVVVGNSLGRRDVLLCPGRCGIFAALVAGRDGRRQSRGHTPFSGSTLRRRK